MTQIPYFLAQIDPKDALMPELQKAASSRGNLTLLFGAIGVVTFLIVVWAIFIRKRPDEGSRRYSYPSRELSESGSQQSGRRRRRRRNRRPRNPTLAETGGLPPIRSEGYSEDAS